MQCTQQPKNNIKNDFEFIDKKQKRKTEGFREIWLGNGILHTKIGLHGPKNQNIIHAQY